MITNKDVRVENGNLVLNGDKYPLDGQSPEAIMAIVEDNSDTTPTEDSIKPITSGGVYAALAGLLKYKDVTVKSDTTGHSAPVQSSGGAYYEPLVTYESIGVNPANVLSIIPVNWAHLQKSFTIYGANLAISTITDSSASIYKDNSSYLVLRIVYK